MIFTILLAIAMQTLQLEKEEDVLEPLTGMMHLFFSAYTFRRIYKYPFQPEKYIRCTLMMIPILVADLLLHCPLAVIALYKTLVVSLYVKRV